jgi:membrane-associated phospholipid phosphatase
VLLVTNIIKELDFEVCKRPYHETFAKEQRTLRGFPSGHLAEATYMAVLYGMRFGPQYAIPLGGVAVFVGCVFLSSNRHYLSQMIAGASFGAMYAFSASKVIDSKLAKRHEMQLGLSVDASGKPIMSLSGTF